VQSLNVARLSRHEEAALRRPHGRKSPRPVAPQQQPVARVVTPLGGRDAGEVAGDDQIDVPIAIDIRSERRVDRRKLCFRRQRAQRDSETGAGDWQNGQMWNARDSMADEGAIRVPSRPAGAAPDARVNIFPLSDLAT